MLLTLFLLYTASSAAYSPYTQPANPATGQMTPDRQMKRVAVSGQKPAAAAPKPSSKDPGHSKGDGHDHHDD